VLACEKGEEEQQCEVSYRANRVDLSGERAELARPDFAIDK